MITESSKTEKGNCFGEDACSQNEYRTNFKPEFCEDLREVGQYCIYLGEGVMMNRMNLKLLKRRSLS
jgi:hypothetical protein